MMYDIPGTVHGGQMTVGGESLQSLDMGSPVVVDVKNVRTTTKLVKTRIRVEACINGLNCSIYVPLRSNFKTKVKQAAVGMGLIDKDAALYFNFIGNTEQLCKNLNVLR
ncbi:hypothetical protein pETSU_127 [Edwardsiella phage pEt-SU]|uniref:Uncharacterized protein n=1 Tax=Edwardsiella phage pEt-SU TaxID=2562142 RepID=A0A4D6DWW1_9CAUD|nr:hypothetical protein HOV39_gp127 [Edwardsiella phage pEt-SU]QBZ70708.1 hypothetical protein pETSU_127 [Edwardsiella phage pEt-SU]